MKHKYISKRYWETTPTALGSVFDLAAQYDDVIDLSIGDPDMTTPKEILELAHQDALAGHTKYTDYRGYPELRSAIADFYKEEYKLTLSDNEIFISTGGCVSMYLAMEAILNDGDEVIIQEPYFTPYSAQVTLARGIPVFLESREEEDWQINFQRLEGLITSRTKAMIINTPNNPTGNCLSLKTLERLSDFAEQHDLLIVADDIYTCFSFEEPFIPPMSVGKLRERTITINSFSKNFIMTGMRIANIIGPADIIKTVQLINENLVFTAPSYSQRAALHALELRRQVQPAIIEEFQKRVHYAADRIQQLSNMSVPAPKGTFYLFPNIKKTGLTSLQIMEILLKEAHVLMLPGNDFGRSGEGYMRISCTVNIDTLKEAFDRIEQMELFRPVK